MKTFLVGFMGSGKTYLGQRLAEALGVEFLDLDAVIETQTGRSIATIFEEEGEAFFRTLERTALLQSLDYQEVIIATGGGTPCFFDNMALMNQHGTTLFLDTAPTLLARRLQAEASHRPLIKGLSMSEIEDFIHKKLIERRHFYEQAHFKILIP